MPQMTRRFTPWLFAALVVSCRCGGPKLYAKTLRLFMAQLATLVALELLPDEPRAD
jgi:hypothetical protein